MKEKQNHSHHLLKQHPLDLSKMPKSAFESEPQKKWLRLVGICFDQTGPIYDFDAQEMSLKLNDSVVVDHPHQGLRLGWVKKAPLKIENDQLNLQLPTILRMSTKEDRETFDNNLEKAQKGVEITQRAAERMNLGMKILRVEYSLDRRKATVFFESSHRVDFRELLKELVHDLKSKVELRQVGIRDETKHIGALGPCGEEVCCSRFLGKFHSVSIKMAKNQELSLKPSKVTGMCGRLKCCLSYEDPTYREELKTLPPQGSCVKCSSGECGVIQSANILKRLINILLDDGTIKTIPAHEIIEIQTLKNVDMAPTKDDEGNEDEWEDDSFERDLDESTSLD